MKLEFYKCSVCGNVIIKVADSGVTPYCCGREAQLMDPNTTEASQESHIPQVRRLDYNTLTVEVGTNLHPMTSEHHIDFIIVECRHGWHIKYLPPTKPPITFFLIGDDIVSVYAYCNIHGLWKCT